MTIHYMAAYTAERAYEGLAVVTDADELASIERNELFDIIGGMCPDGKVRAYTWSLERYRRDAATRTAENAPALWAEFAP